MLATSMANEGREDTNRRVYSGKQMAAMLGKTTACIYRWAREGKIPSKRVGRHVLFPKDTVDRWLNDAVRDGR